MKTITGLLLLILLVAGYAAGTGVYNIAATEKHWGITEKLIEWMRINSVKARAEALVIPESDESDYLSIGAEHYHAMCTECHLSPGQEPTELAQGLYPQAPVFHQRVSLTDPEALKEQTRAYFWVIKNGVKMTAMPAWGLTHDDETIWSMAFFVQKLSNMPVSEYDQLTHTNGEDHQQHAHEHGDKHQHGHRHEHEHEQHNEHDGHDNDIDDDHDD